jgi:hypothetical protein
MPIQPASMMMEVSIVFASTGIVETEPSAKILMNALVSMPAMKMQTVPTSRDTMAVSANPDTLEMEHLVKVRF